MFIVAVKPICLFGNPQSITLKSPLMDRAMSQRMISRPFKFLSRALSIVMIALANLDMAHRLQEK